MRLARRMGRRRRGTQLPALAARAAVLTHTNQTSFFTEEERNFLEAAVTAFIRRAAEKAAVPNRDPPCVTMADLPKLPNQAGLTSRQP